MSHLSGRIVANTLDADKNDRSSRANLYNLSCLVACGVYLQAMSPLPAAGSYPALFIFSLMGSFVSVALSLGLRSVAVSNHTALCYPDFPPLS